MLFIGAAASLSSNLLVELSQGLRGLSLSSPSHALADVPAFLSRTGICRLEISAMSSAAEAAQADRVLRQCDTITSLHCGSGVPLHFWPPNLENLTLAKPACLQGKDAAELADAQHVQLLRLQDAPRLQQLTVATCPVCKWLADLAGSLPGRLQKVEVSLWVSEEDNADLEPSCAVDLSAFSKAAGCTAELDVSIVAWGWSDAEDRFVPGSLAGLRAVGSFHLLHREWTAERVAEHVLELSQLQCSHCILLIFFQAHFAQLPTLGHLTLVLEEWDHQTLDPLSCEWAALASPGVRCLGRADHPVLALEIRGCSGLPAHGQPWALAVWADMSTVRGLPVRCFVEEAPGMHVWRNAAGRDQII